MAKEDEEPDEEDGDRRHDDGDRANGALDSPHLRFHVLSAGLELSLLGRFDIGGEHFVPPGLHLLDVTCHDLLRLIAKIGSFLDLPDSCVKALARLGQRFPGVFVGSLLLVCSCLGERADLNFELLERFDVVFVAPSK